MSLLRRLRLLFWAIVLGALVLVAIGILVPGATGSFRWFVAVVAPFGAVMLAVARWVAGRPLDASGPGELAASFVRSTIGGAALAESPALLGAVGSMATGDPWSALVGGAWSMLAFSFVAPSEANLDRREEHLRSLDSRYSLRDALSRGDAL
ncbi:MAG TPA: hypothetical protein VF029_01000 [Actinomycetota bacterium]